MSLQGYTDPNGATDASHVLSVASYQNGGESSTTEESGLLRVQQPSRPRFTKGRWVLGLLILASFIVGTILFSSHEKTQTTPLLTDNSICPVVEDPIQQLEPTSTIDDLQNGAVASDHPLCSKLGTSILQDHNGNAVDAAIATALCLGVANPASSGIGGGAFLLVHADATWVQEDHDILFDDKRNPQDILTDTKKGVKITEIIDCREVAGEHASTYMFKGLPHNASVHGGLAVAVPGELRGLELAHARHGSLPWKTLVEPAAKMAREGVVVSAYLQHEIQSTARAMIRQGGDDGNGLCELLTHDCDWTRPLKEGDVLKNIKLAETLEAVIEEGADALYQGERAKMLAQDIQRAGGILTQNDIESYHPTLRSPVIGHAVNGFSIVGVPPPSSGGATLIGAARFLAGYKNPLATFADTLSVHRFVEACRHAFAIRMSLSDPEYNTEQVKEAVHDLVKGGHMDELRKISMDHTSLPLSRYGGEKWGYLNDDDGNAVAVDAHEGDRRRLLHTLSSASGERRLARRFGYLEDHGTTHFSIVDKEGNSVSMTSSVNLYFGSRVVSRSTGIILNNQMDDFGNPGVPNHYGLHPSAANFIMPGKKPLSSMSPTMVFETKESHDGVENSLGDLVLVLGGSGGPKIITATMQVLLNYVMLGKSLFESMARPRVHDQLLYHGASVACTEKAPLEQGPTIDLPQETRMALERRGHKLLDIDYTGTVQAVAVNLESHTVSAVSDIRKGGTPFGY